MEVIGEPMEPHEVRPSLSPEERAEMEEFVAKLKTERDTLKDKVKDWMHVIVALPEWEHWCELKRGVALARKHTLESFDVDWAADEADEMLNEAIEEEKEYRPIIKAAIKALSFGEEYIAAKKRLKELKWLV
jgi:hypothetical protein